MAKAEAQAQMSEALVSGAQKMFHELMELPIELWIRVISMFTIVLAFIIVPDQMEMKT